MFCVGIEKSRNVLKYRVYGGGHYKNKFVNKYKNILDFHKKFQKYYFPVWLAFNIMDTPFQFWRTVTYTISEK